MDFNTLRPNQNGRHFPDDIFKCMFLNKNVWISLKISLKFVPKVRINNIPALVQIMAWCRPGDKPLSEPMMVSLLTHICVTRSQWVNTEILSSPGPRVIVSNGRQTTCPIFDRIHVYPIAAAPWLVVNHLHQSTQYQCICPILHWHWPFRSRYCYEHHISVYTTHKIHDMIKNMP